MKKLLVLTFICAAVAISCGKKIMPESGANNQSSSSNDKTSKTSTQSGTTNTNTNTSASTTPTFGNVQKSTPPDGEGSRFVSMDKAKTIYVAKCGSCHGLKNPSDYTQEQIHNILKVEIPKAKLTSKESELVTAYMLENSKK